MYKIKARKGWIFYKITLYRKWLFLWIPLVDWKIPIGEEYGVKEVINDLMEDYNIPEERVFLKPYKK